MNLIYTYIHKYNDSLLIRLKLNDLTHIYNGVLVIYEEG